MSTKDAMLAKMAALKAKREDARTANTAEVAEEDRKAKLPKNFEAKKAQAEWEEAEAKAKKEAEAAGLDYERVKNKKRTALDADARDRRKKKKNTDPGFSDYSAMQFRQYQRLTKQLKPDTAAYKKSKAEWGDDDASANTMAYGQHDAVSAKGLDRMVKDLEAQAEKRAKFSRRRAEYHDADISYINERNRNFNKKLDRFYGKVTQGIRDNLERGTAI